MMDERRYRDDEIREIFDLAAESEHGEGPSDSPGEGLTLAELQEIGSEVDLAPERIARAAHALELRGGATPRGRRMGLPVSVGRLVALPRAPTDREWALLVTELRRTFGARGNVSTYGDLREWTNGNLHVYVEPTESGHRLRMGTLKGSALAYYALGGLAMGAGAAVLVAALLAGNVGDSLLPALVLGAHGGVALATNVLRLPSWATTRERQMERVARHTLALLGQGPTEEGEGNE